MIIFEENRSLGKLGRTVGLLTSYTLFTTITFFITKITNKTPPSWNYFHIATITFIIIITGIVLKKLLR